MQLVTLFPERVDLRALLGGQLAGGAQLFFQRTQAPVRTSSRAYETKENINMNDGNARYRTFLEQGQLIC